MTLYSQCATYLFRCLQFVFTEHQFCFVLMYGNSFCCSLQGLSTKEDGKPPLIEPTIYLALTEIL